MGRRIDLKGQRFGRLVVVEFAGTSNDKRALWKCVCDCGNETIVRGKDLRQSHVKSCGCLHKEGNNKTHGKKNTKVYNSWRAMRERCYNPKNKQYHDYGGRGISVCKEWRDSFEAFDEDVSRLVHYNEEGYTLNRLRNDEDYKPDNVEWANRAEQGRNKRNNHRITFNGETHSISEWAEIMGIRYSTLNSRLNRYHWSIERALTESVKER